MAERANEEKNVQDRDFVGPDCTSWVYDLHRPDEPYANRGAHPSGTGVDRYIPWSALSNDEKEFTSRQVSLSFLNYVNPILYRRYAFQAEDYKWNANLKHYIMPFGGDVVAVFFLQGERTWIGQVHFYQSPVQTFPGFDLRMEGWSLSENHKLNADLSIWSQPKGLRCDEKSAALGGRASLELESSLTDKWNSKASLRYKSQGWDPGEISLDPELSLRAGLIYLL